MLLHDKTRRITNPGITVDILEFYTYFTMIIVLCKNFPKKKHQKVHRLKMPTFLKSELMLFLFLMCFDIIMLMLKDI